MCGVDIFEKFENERLAIREPNGSVNQRVGTFVKQRHDGNAWNGEHIYSVFQVGRDTAMPCFYRGYIFGMCFINLESAVF